MGPFLLWHFIPGESLSAIRRTTQFCRLIYLGDGRGVASRLSHPFGIVVLFIHNAKNFREFPARLKFEKSWRT